MSLICRDIISKIENSYPLWLAEDYDNVGLIVGSSEREIERILICLDIDYRVVEEAVDRDIDMIISHHPLIFKPVKRITDNNYISSMLMKLIRNDINVYALHTNFDTAVGGINDILGKLLGIQNIMPLCRNKPETLYKIAVYVPVSHVESVRNAMFKSGCGHIGNYSQCSFNINGTGTFMPLKGTSPYIGREGKLEFVEEVKVETIVREKDLDKAVAGMLKAHPYEEAAYDIYKLENSITHGTGIYGTLEKKITLEELCSHVKSRLNIPALNAAGNMEEVVNKVAVVGGSGFEFYKDAIKMGCDVLITGDVKHHEAIEAVNSGINIIDAGHYYTEIAALPFIADFLRCSFDVECIISEVNTNPFTKV